LFRRWKTVTGRVQPVVTVPALTTVAPSSARREVPFSEGGRVLLRMSWKMVEWETVLWDVFRPVRMFSICVLMS
jgi:hypothetical protein